LKGGKSVRNNAVGYLFPRGKEGRRQGTDPARKKKSDLLRGGRNRQKVSGREGKLSRGGGRRGGGLQKNMQGSRATGRAVYRRSLKICGGSTRSTNYSETLDLSQPRLAPPRTKNDTKAEDQCPAPARPTGRGPLPDVELQLSVKRGEKKDGRAPQDGHYHRP